MEVIVPDEFLSIAIGKKGQNVRLASKLTGWHLDVKSETKYSAAMQSGYDSLIALPGIGISMADALYELGFYSAEEVGNAAPEDLIQVRGIGEEKARTLIAAAQVAVVEAEQAEDMDEEEMAEAAPGESDSEEGDEASAQKAESEAEKDDELSPQEAENNTQTGEELSAEEAQSDSEKSGDVSAQKAESEAEKGDELSPQEPESNEKDMDNP
jgi:N utilization substance protein A